jgi:hypothetical protein
MIIAVEKNSSAKTTTVCMLMIPLYDTMKNQAKVNTKIR